MKLDFKKISGGIFKAWLFRNICHDVKLLLIFVCVERYINMYTTRDYKYTCYHNGMERYI